jgi:hypothetical protein
LYPAPDSPIVPHEFASHKPVNIVESVRALRGRSRPCLVKADDGRYFVQKRPGYLSGTNVLFNEAFASLLGSALKLPFAAWSELAAGSGALESTFGSEMISGHILEYLPRGWYQNIQNRSDIYRCLLFDLWCNHADPRQAIFQMRSPHVLHAYFVDHDQMFSADDEGPLFRRLARTMYLDRQIYKDPPVAVIRDLRALADNITLLAMYKLHHFQERVPISWGTLAHRKEVILGLQRRTVQLPSYIEAIMQFSSTSGY